MPKRKRGSKSSRKRVGTRTVKSGKRRRIASVGARPSLSFQRDKTVYSVTKKFNKKKFKRKQRFVNRVRDVILGGTGMKSAQRVASVAISVGASAQGFNASTFAGGSLGAVNTDLASMVSSVEGGTFKKNVTLKLKYSEQELYLTNTSAAISGVVPVMFVKCYHVVARKDFDGTTNGFNSIGASFSASFADENVLDVPFNTALTATTFGATPFDTPDFCEHWKILSVEEFELSGGQVCQLGFRIAKRFWIPSIRISDNSALRGITQGYLIVCKGAPDGSGNPYAGTVVAHVTNRYHYNHIEDDIEAAGKP